MLYIVLVCDRAQTNLDFQDSTIRYVKFTSFQALIKINNTWFTVLFVANFMKVRILKYVIKLISCECPGEKSRALDICYL